MPTYQYVCTDCGTPLEAQQSFSDAALTACPACQGRLRKVFSAVGVVFKGSGFYRNDSRAPQTSAESGSAESASAADRPDTSSNGDKPDKPDTSDKPATGKPAESGSGTGGKQTAGASSSTASSPPSSAGSAP